MKFTLAAALLCFAQPAIAFDRMLLGDCQSSFEQLAELISPDDEKTPRMTGSISATFDGWCKITGGASGFEDANFETLSWRTDDTDRWTGQGIPPLALELNVTGLNPDQMQASSATHRPPVSVEVTLRQHADAGQLILESARMYNDLGDSMVVSGVFERVFLSSPSMMQVSVGAATFKAGLFLMTLDGTHENPFGFGIDADLIGDDEAQQGAAFEVLSGLPEGVMDDESRAELAAFSGDLPNPVGTLELVVGSERGLGLMQVGAAVNRMISIGSTVSEGVDLADMLEVLFDGLSVSAEWTPRVSVTD